MNTMNTCVGCSQPIATKPRKLRGHTWHKDCADKSVAQNRKQLAMRYKNAGK